MHCPYCTSEINDAALVCPVCTRDLYLFKPLLARIEALEKQIEASAAENSRVIEERLSALEKELQQFRAAGAVPFVQGTAPPGTATATPSPAPRSFYTSAAIAMLVTVALLLAAHVLIVIMYDLKPLYLRIASLLIPLPFGFALYVRHPQRAWVSAALATLAACAAVVGMSAITGHVDNVPVLPRDLREWREFIEYAASIAFSFATGMLLGKLRYHRMQASPEPNRLIMFIARLMATDDKGKLNLQKTVERLSQLGTLLAPAGTAAVSIYTGIKALIGDS